MYTYIHICTYFFSLEPFRRRTASGHCSLTRSRIVSTLRWRSWPLHPSQEKFSFGQHDRLPAGEGGTGPGRWSVGFPRKANRVHLEPECAIRGCRCAGGVSAGPDGGAGGAEPGMCWMNISSGSESGGVRPKAQVPHHSGQRKPDLAGSWDIAGGPQGSPGTRISWVPRVLEVPRPRLVWLTPPVKQTQSLWMPHPSNSESHCSGTSPQSSRQIFYIHI